MSEKLTDAQLRRKYPDIYAKTEKICSGRSCGECPLFNCCSRGFTVEKVEAAYNSLFGKDIEIKETNVLDLFGS